MSLERYQPLYGRQNVKSVKKPEKYSDEAKETLPEMRSLFGPSDPCLTEPGRECWPEQKECFRVFPFVDQKCFSGKKYLFFMVKRRLVTTSL